MLGHLAEVLRSMSRTSAIAPILFLCVIVAIVVLPAIFLGTFWVQLFLMFLFAICIFVALGSFIYFMIKDPNKLTSESHAEKMRAYEMLGDEKHKFGTTADHIVAVANPRLPELSDKDVVPMPENAPKQRPPFSGDEPQALL